MDSQSKKPIFGVILVIVGILFLLRSLNVIWFTPGDVVERLMPFAMIALGGWMIVRRKKKSDVAEVDISEQQSSHREEPQPERVYSSQEQSKSQAGSGPRVSTSPDESEPGKLKFSKYLGDLNIDCCDLDLKSTEISTFLGDIEVKIHGAILGQGLNRMIISGFVGDIRVFVPHDLPVFLHCSNFVGEIEILGKRTSGFGNHVEGQSSNYSSADDKLFIAVNCFISDIRIYTI